MKVVFFIFGLLNPTKIPAVPALLIGMSLLDREITAMIFRGDSLTGWP